MNKVLVLVVLLVFGVFGAYSQAVNSVQDGSWDDPNTWSGGAVPDVSDGSVVIIVDHVVFMPTNVSMVASATVSSGASLTVNSGVNLDFAGGNLDVWGDLIASNTSTITNTDGSNVLFEAGSIYHHLFTTTEGVIPLATWDANSTVSIEGYTNLTTATAGGNWGQDFGFFTWNCTNQTLTFSMEGLLSSIATDLTVTSTNIGTLQLSDVQSPTINIGGSISVGGTSKLNFTVTGAPIINVAGDFVLTSTNTTGSFFSFNGGSCDLTVLGNFYMDAIGGVLNFSKASGSGTMNLLGNFTLNNGTLTETGSVPSTGNINFVGIGTQTFINTGTIVNTFAYTVAATSTLDMIGESNIRSSTVGSLVVDGKIRIASVNGTGALVTGSLLGNIRVAGIRTFNSGSSIVYSGSAAQFIGNGHPSTSGVNMEVANGSGVTANNLTLTVGGNLMLTSGDLTYSPTSAKILTIGGNLTSNGHFIYFTGTLGSLIINGSGAIGTFPLPAASPVTMANLTISRGGSIIFPPTLSITGTAAINNGDVQFNGATTTIKILNIAGGGVTASVDFNGTGVITGSGSGVTLASPSKLYFEGQSLSIQNTITTPVLTGSFSANSTSTLTLTGSKNFGTLIFASGGNTIGTFNMNIPASGTPDVTINGILNIATALNLQNGKMFNSSGLTMANGATITRTVNAGALTTASDGGAVSAAPLGGPYNLVYIGTNGTNTAAEGQGSINNLTINMTAPTNVVTAGFSMAIAGQLLITNGIFSTTNASTITAATFNNTVNGTFRGPSGAPNTTVITLTGNFTNDGVFTANRSTFNFNGTSSILGSVAPTFADVMVSNTLNAPANLNLSGDFTNNGTFNAGTGTVTFNGTAGTQNILGSSATTFNNITDTNTSGTVQVQSNHNLKGILTLTGNPTVFDADGSTNTSVFTLLSTGDNPTADASIATLGTGASVTGNVTVQRYMAIEGANTGRIYRYVSSPVSNATAADIQNEIPITGTFTGNSNGSCSGCASGTQSMFGYTESTAGVFDLGYDNFPAATNTETFAIGKGYTIYVRGNILSSALWDLRGPVNQGSVALPVGFTSTTGGVANDGWNLVGNPYPSTIDWNSGSWTKAGLDGSIYIRDNGQTVPVYATYNGSVGTNGGSQYIPTGQGFWVKATSAPTLTATESIKVAGQSTTFIRQATPENLLRITMRDAVNRDEAVIHFRDDATVNFDKHADTWKLVNATFNLSSVLADGQKLAINSLPAFDCTKNVKLDVTSSAGAYKFEFSDFESFSSHIQLSLVDNFTGKTVDIRNATGYDFQVTSDVKSYGSGRFSVNISTPQLQDVALTVADVCMGNDASVSLANTQSGVSYQLVSPSGELLSSKVNSDGDAFTLTVSNAKLIAGGNTINLVSSVEGCLTTKSQVTQVTTLPVSQVTSVDSAGHCQAGSVTLMASGASDQDHYNWYETEQSLTPVSEATGSSFVTPVLSDSKTYYVSISTALGCEGSRMPVIAKIINYENVEILDLGGNYLKSSLTSGNQWSFNGVAIPEATNQLLKVDKSGTYSVQVKTEGCSTTADLVFLVTGNEVDIASIISVYPNPVENDLNVEIPATLNVQAVKLFSNLGVQLNELILSEHSGVKKGRFNMNGLPSGLYIVRVLQAGKWSNVKVSKK